MRLLPPPLARELFSYALLIGSISATVFIFWLRRLDLSPPAPTRPEPRPREERPSPPDHLVPQLQAQITHLRTQLEAAQNQAQHILLQKQTELEDLTKSVQDQRQLIAKKQLRIAKLEAKVRDLNYEVKTLLQLDDLRTDEEPPPVATPLPAEPLYEERATTPTQASLQLHRLITGAQRLSGMANLTNRYETSALDLRRLFDHLQDDANIILVYSKRDGQLLFANNQVRTQLGWTPERFTKEFFLLLQHGIGEFHRAITTLDHQPTTHITLVLKQRDSLDFMGEAVLSKMSSGPFAGLIIMLVFQSEKIGGAAGAPDSAPR
jgi:PAS domain-containing protein